jgi:hypothetical protein
MKKNKINNLAFNKTNIVELNNNQLSEVAGGFGKDGIICTSVRCLIDLIDELLK